MQAEINRRLETLLCTAIEINDAAGREIFLHRACGTDDELREQVSRLVADHFRAGGFLKFRATSIAETMALPMLEQAGSRIGNYKLLEQIGEGGMGIVFMAEQVVPVRRRVALKITKPGMDSQQIIARFEAERQALAMMEHPNISKVLDAGTTDSGRPYFVMELVRGMTITEFCDQVQLSTRERLLLFKDICAAIQHANGADLIVTINPEQPDNKNSLVLFTSFEKPYTDVRVWIDDGMQFDHYLENYWPQRHGHSGVYKVSDFKGDKLFVRFEIGHADVGRYEFIFGNIASLSSYLHQKKCMFKVSAPVRLSANRERNVKT